MFQWLRIREMALIDEAEIEFKPGLNILSGETGAGKSIVIEAITLLLGARAQVGMVRAGADEAIVEGLFDVSANRELLAKLKDAGIAVGDDGELVIRRVLSAQGRHRVTLNGSLVTATSLRAWCEDLVDVCGQNEFQSLLKPSVRIGLLDRYGGLQEIAQELHRYWDEYRALTEAREKLQGDGPEGAQRQEFLRFQVAELEGESIEEGEDEALSVEKRSLQTAAQRAQAVQSILRALEGDSDSDSRGVIETLQLAIQDSVTWARLAGEEAEFAPALGRALAEAESAALSASRQTQLLDEDPGRLEKLQERLSRISQLKRKFGVDTAQGLRDRLDLFKQELVEIETRSERLALITQEMESARLKLEKLGAELSARRAAVALTLSDSITAELRELQMPDARLRVSVTSKKAVDEWNTAGAADGLDFLIQPNRGEPERRIEETASGGELSRLMLAIRRVVSDRGGIGVYLFDEVDAGIGGAVAFQVGRKLRSVSRNHQVICITHLPQVAAFADHHLVVSKSSESGRTVTSVRALKTRDRTDELARMLGGDKPTLSSRRNARELIDSALQT